MQDVEGLFKTAVAEIERMLNSKTVVGEPMTVEGNTLIPLISVGFGFGAGGGTGKAKAGEEGTGGGTGGGGGVKPVALIVINADGVRVEPIKGGAASVLEKVAEACGAMAAKKGGENCCKHDTD
ncbi:MAG: spore germination protein GerW family protein [Nitrospirota bacterium]|nr:spore germination protein GerW family protein [Nitrospirota bacterium]